MMSPTVCKLLFEACGLVMVEPEVHLDELYLERIHVTFNDTVMFTSAVKLGNLSQGRMGFKWLLETVSGFV